jgi:hypothetical protein
MVCLFSLVSLSPVQAQGSGGYPGSGGSGGGSGGGATPPPSHCWQITYAQTGIWGYVYYNASTGTRTSQQGLWTNLVAPNNTSGGGDAHGYSPILGAVTDGTVTATLTWIPAIGQTLATDPPSEPVYIQEYSRASWAAAWDPSGSSAPSFADYTGAGADDGLGDPMVYNVSSGTHLLTHDGSSGVIVLPSVSLSAHNPQSQWIAYPGMNRYFWSWSGGGLIQTYFDASVDTNQWAVTISSPIETSYYKYTGPNQSGTIERWIHQRDPITGAMKVDSVATYSNADNAHAWVGRTPLVANPIDFANPTYSWASDFNPVDIIGVDMTQQSIPASWFLYDTGKLPVTKNITVIARDTNGDTASNTYAITWHLPYEVVNPQPFAKTHTKKWLGDALITGIPAGETWLRNPSPAKPIKMSAAFDSGAAIVAFTGPEDAPLAGLLEIAGKVAELSNWEYDWPGEPADSNVSKGATNDGNVGTNLTGNWELANADNSDKCPSDGLLYAEPDAPNVPSDLLGLPTGWQKCTLAIHTVEFDTDESWDADGYNNNGYDGNPYHVVAVHKVDLVHDEPYFLKAVNPPGTP